MSVSFHPVSEPWLTRQCEVALFKLCKLGNQHIDCDPDLAFSPPDMSALVLDSPVSVQSGLKLSIAMLMPLAICFWVLRRMSWSDQNFLPH